MARHALGVLGVVAAGILLVVSAAMNYRFGYSLGKTEMDGQIYGAASAAADCFKALVPFFLFAAIRNRMWSQAFAATLVWTVVTAYSMTSALGHAALNRLDTTGQRAADSANYKDLRADSKRAQDQLTWIPAHRPAETVSSELNVLKAQRPWLVTKECTEVTGKNAREFCQQFHKLNAELASAQQSKKLESRISEIGAKLAKTAGGTVMAEADPQASVLAKITGLEVDKVQTALTIFVALLIEIGSAFGMYVAFAYWRINDRAPEQAPARPAVAAATVAPATVRARSSRGGNAGGRAAGCRGGGAGCGRASGPAPAQCQRQPAAAGRPRQRCAALLQRKGGCRFREREPHVDRALRGVLSVVRGQREGALRPSQGHA